MKKIVLVNQKGGCGKTTAAINIASCLAEKGNKVLVVDLDPQGHCGLGLGVQPDFVPASVYEVLTGVVTLSQAIQPVRHNLDIVCSNVVLSAFEQSMTGVPQREYRLAQCLPEIEASYDYLITDCPPGVGLLSFNGLLAADEAIIPVDPSPFSLHGLEKLLETIRLIEKQAGHKLLYRILATNIDRRTRYGNTVLETLRTRFEGHCFTTFINACTRLRDAADQGLPISEYDRNCAAFRDYESLTKELLPEGAAIAAENPGGQKIVFSIEAPEDATVQIAGDFTGWEPMDLRLNKTGTGPLWKRAMLLGPGTYEYKYLVNGQWLPDPANRALIDNRCGSVNSVISISG